MRRPYPENKSVLMQIWCPNYSSFTSLQGNKSRMSVLFLFKVSLWKGNEADVSSVSPSFEMSVSLGNLSKQDVNGGENVLWKCNFAFLQSFLCYPKSLRVPNVLTIEFVVFLSLSLSWLLKQQHCQQLCPCLTLSLPWVPIGTNRFYSV